MKTDIIVHVLEFDQDNEKTVEQQVCTPTVYDDGTISVSGRIEGTDHYVHLRFNIAELVEIGMTSESREEG